MDIPANYIELGLYALARSGEKGWFDGHFGAALLSAFYLNEENSLSRIVAMSFCEPRSCIGRLSS